MGQLSRLNPFAFTGLFTGDFPVAWFVTMIAIALLGGFGMGTTLDWYTEVQRIQSARTVRDASYGIWGGTLLILVCSSLWAASVIGFYTLQPRIAETADYEMAWYRVGFENLPPGMIGFFFASSQSAVSFSSASGTSIMQYSSHSVQSS